MAHFSYSGMASPQARVSRTVNPLVGPVYLVRTVNRYLTNSDEGSQMNTIFMDFCPKQKNMAAESVT
jgi:hypothetical protein